MSSFILKLRRVFSRTHASPRAAGDTQPGNPQSAAAGLFEGSHADRIAKRPLPEDWAEQTRQLHLWARGGQWLHYRNRRMALADLLLKRGREVDALEQLLEVWFVDLNGPGNALPPSVALLATEAGALNPAQGGTQARVRRQVRRLMAQLEYEVDDVQSLFFATASNTYRRYRLPVSPSQAWLAVGAHLLE